MFKLNLEKAEETEIKLTTSAGSQKIQENSRKTSSSASLTMIKLFFFLLRILFTSFFFILFLNFT